MIKLLFVFMAAFFCEFVLASWTKAVADSKRTKAVFLTVILELVRVPAAVLVISDAEPFSREQFIRIAVGAVGYALATFTSITLNRRDT